MSDRKKMEDHWDKYGKQHLVGKKVVSVRFLTKGELEGIGWEHTGSSTWVLQFDDGSLLFPSADDEGNGPGALFGQSADGESLTFPVMWVPREVK